MRNKITEVFHEALEMTNSQLTGELSDDTILLESGLDSLGFAILVARLEEELGYDPFSVMDNAVYPTTFKDFVDIYHQY
ncbi:acyl carrier protein [Photorhabdus heterorhabditis]|uniref:Acyl carrier protein n=1 Tax=Photorhabdus heterorhabditis TaxID=880156 RepID=A0ABR5K7P4_9GAMM|nr:acyl carrier protein [Photorhabdus heterorhabditis]